MNPVSKEAEFFKCLHGGWDLSFYSSSGWKGMAIRPAFQGKRKK
jgi:hypothetical protein